VVLAQAVNWDNARMFELAGDFGLTQKASSAFRMVGVLRLDFLESHLAVQLLVMGHKHLT
jgi:hypothetical protein